MGRRSDNPAIVARANAYRAFARSSNAGACGVSTAGAGKAAARLGPGARGASTAGGVGAAARQYGRLGTLLAAGLVVFWAFAPAPVGANEAFVSTGGGTASLRRAAETSVRMRAEYIDINLCEHSYEVDALFVFDNPGETVTHEVGFPRFSFGDREVEAFREFRSWVNDEPVEALEIPAAGGARDLRRSDGERAAEALTPRVESYYVRDVEFPANEMTTTRVRYRADYGRDRLFRTVSYLYGTAHTWSGDVDTMTVRIRNDSERWIDSFSFVDPAREHSPHVAFATQGARDFDLIKTDVSPGEHATFELFIERYPWWLGDPLSSDTSDDWIFDRVEVKRDYLRLLTLRQLRIFRNTFFARAGYDFGDGELGRYFAQFRWYSPHTTRLGDLLNETEERNIEIIEAEEERRRTFVSE